MPWLDINQERQHAYMGYVGMVKLVQEIDKALYNPVWEQVRQPAPWEKTVDSWQANAPMPQMDAEAARSQPTPCSPKKRVAPRGYATARPSISARSRTRSMRTRHLTVEGVRQHTNASGGCGAVPVRIEDVGADDGGDPGRAVPSGRGGVAARHGEGHDRQEGLYGQSR